MEINLRLEQILKQLEDDRQLALKEYANIQNELPQSNPQFKHLSREVAVQALRLAVDASINMAKAISTLTKDQPMSGVSVDKKELLLLLDSIEKGKNILEDTGEETIEPQQLDEIALEEEKEVADESKLLAEIDEIIDEAQADTVTK
jgi:hypothetical protein